MIYLYGLIQPIRGRNRVNRTILILRSRKVPIKFTLSDDNAERAKRLVTFIFITEEIRIKYKANHSQPKITNSLSKALAYDILPQKTLSFSATPSKILHFACTLPLQK